MHLLSYWLSADQLLSAGVRDRAQLELSEPRRGLRLRVPVIRVSPPVNGSAVIPVPVMRKRNNSDDSGTLLERDPDLKQRPGEAAADWQGPGGERDMGRPFSR